MKKIFFLILLFFIIGKVQTLAAVNDTIWVGGQIVDGFTNKQIEDADITFMQTDSSVVSKGRPINWTKKYGLKDEVPFIAYNLPVPGIGKYIIKVFSPQYKTKFVNFEIKGKNVESWELPIINLDKNPYVLKEAVVKASKVMMINKGDTVVYNASAFQLAEGSMLDQLIAQLPGVKLNNQGQIFVNGQYVSSLLLNGKDFFKGDANVALKNLPAYTVDQIKSYKKGSGADYLFKRDSTERLQDELVLDVILKKEYNESWVTNADVAYGTDDRYAARLFALRFTNKTRLAAFANFNNIGITQQPGEYTDNSIEVLPIQPATDKSGGLDFRIETGERHISFNSVLTLTNREQNTITETAANNIFSDYQTFNRLRTVSDISRTDLMWMNLLCIPARNVYTELAFRGEYGRNKFNTLNRSIDLNTQPFESYRLAALDSIFNGNARKELIQSMINRYRQLSASTVHRYFAIASGMVKWKAPVTGSPMSLYSELSYEKQRDERSTTYDIKSFPTPYSVNREQYAKSPLEDLSGSVRLEYEHQLSAGMKMLFKYEFAAQRRNSDRALDTLYIMPDKGMSRLLAADIQNSYERTLHKYSNTPGVQFNYIDPKWMISLNLPVRFTHARMDEYRRSAIKANPHRKYAAFEPKLMINSNNGLVFVYQYSQNEPEMVYLTGLSDDSDPMNIMLGNTNLHNKGVHTANINYSKSYTKNARNLGLGGTFTVSHNDIALQRNYNTLTGVSTYTPQNINGNWELQLSGNYSQTLDKKQHWMPELNTEFNLTNSAGYTSINQNSESIKNTMRSYTLAQQLGLRYQSGNISLRLSARGEWLHGVSSQKAISNVNIRKYKYALTALLPVVWGITLNTDLALYSLHGYQEESMNTNNVVLNASLSKSFLKNKSLTLQCTGFDLLNKINDIRQSINSQGRIETWTNSISRYVMFHLIYKFSKKPRQQQQAYDY